jgi:hypothetical protein
MKVVSPGDVRCQSTTSRTSRTSRTSLQKLRDLVIDGYVGFISTHGYIAGDGFDVYPVSVEPDSAAFTRSLLAKFREYLDLLRIADIDIRRGPRFFTHASDKPYSIDDLLDGDAALCELEHIEVYFRFLYACTLTGNEVLMHVVPMGGIGERFINRTSLMRRHDSFDLLHKHRFYFWNFGAGAGHVIMQRKKIALNYEIVRVRDDEEDIEFTGLRLCEFIIRCPYVTLAIDDDYLAAGSCPDRFKPVNAGVRHSTTGVFTICRFVTLELYAAVIQRAWRRWAAKKAAARTIWSAWERVKFNPRTLIGRKRFLCDMVDMDARIRHRS